MCSIEFLVILNYPAIANIFAINQIIIVCYNGGFLGTMALCYSGVPLYYKKMREVDIDESRIQNVMAEVKFVNFWFIRTLVAFAQYFFNLPLFLIHV